MVPVSLIPRLFYHPVIKRLKCSKTAWLWLLIEGRIAWEQSSK